MEGAGEGEETRTARRLTQLPAVAAAVVSTRVYGENGEEGRMWRDDVKRGRETEVEGGEKRKRER